MIGVFILLVVCTESISSSVLPASGPNIRAWIAMMTWMAKRALWKVKVSRRLWEGRGGDNLQHDDCDIEGGFGLLAESYVAFLECDIAVFGDVPCWTRLWTLWIAHVWSALSVDGVCPKSDFESVDGQT